MARWTLDDMPDQTGRIAIVTGANTGIGYETARALARKHARVILACRSLEKGRAAADRIRAEQPDADVALELLDLADCTTWRPSPSGSEHGTTGSISSS